MVDSRKLTSEEKASYKRELRELENRHNSKFRELTSEEKECFAKEVRQFLLRNDLWVDTRIYFNGKAFSTYDRNGNHFCNDPNHLVVLEDEDPRNYFEYVAKEDILSMSFEGPLYRVMNYHCEWGADFDDRILKELNEILEQYGVYYELGHAWNLTCFYSWKF